MDNMQYQQLLQVALRQQQQQQQLQSRADAVSLMEAVASGAPGIGAPSGTSPTMGGTSNPNASAAFLAATARSNNSAAAAGSAWSDRGLLQTLQQQHGGGGAIPPSGLLENLQTLRRLQQAFGGPVSAAGFASIRAASMAAPGNGPAAAAAPPAPPASADPTAAKAPAPGDLSALLWATAARPSSSSSSSAVPRMSADVNLDTLRLRAGLWTGDNNTTIGSTPAPTANIPPAHGNALLLHQYQQQLGASAAYQQQPGSSIGSVNDAHARANAQLASLVDSSLGQHKSSLAQQVPGAFQANPSGVPSQVVASDDASARKKDRGIRTPSAATATSASSTNHMMQSRMMMDDEENEDILIPKLPLVRPLPPLEEGVTPPYAERSVTVPLATDEDANWLSERQVFIRAELLEVVRASNQDVLVRSSSKSVAYQQVGIRCRYCAHVHPSARAIRSSAYPSSIRQMYQSFTMMVRDHWAGCKSLPPKLKQRFLAYQEYKIPSSSLSREYWAYAAAKIGMINTTDGGITITQGSMDTAKAMLSFGTTPEYMQCMQIKKEESEAPLSSKPAPADGKPIEIPLLVAADQATLSPYLHLLMSEVTRCELLESERVGKRKAAPAGLSGFGCKHCIFKGRLGFCRVFPLNKRSMPTKVNDVYTHFQRCPLTPASTRALLRKYRREAIQATHRAGIRCFGKNAEQDREFIDQLWTKLGRTGFQIS